MLFTATVTRCFRETLEMFQRAAEGKRGEEALHAMGEAYVAELVTGDRVRLRAQLQAYAACDDPDIQRRRPQRLRRPRRLRAARLRDCRRRRSRAFFATGMLLNVLASMQVMTDPEPWAQQLLEGCGKEI